MDTGQHAYCISFLAGMKMSFRRTTGKVCCMVEVLIKDELELVTIYAFYGHAKNQYKLGLCLVSSGITITSENPHFAFQLC